jgi:hypothetical protein
MEGGRVGCIKASVACLALAVGELVSMVGKGNVCGIVLEVAKYVASGGWRAAGGVGPGLRQCAAARGEQSIAKHRQSWRVASQSRRG